MSSAISEPWENEGQSGSGKENFSTAIRIGSFQKLSHLPDPSRHDKTTTKKLSKSANSEVKFNTKAGQSQARTSERYKLCF